MEPATQRTIPAMLFAGARRFAERLAVADGADRVTYAELAGRAVAVARAARALGVVPGDRVGLWATNSARWVEVSLGLHLAGGVVVPLNTRYRGAEARDILARVRARLVVVSSGFLGYDYAAAALDPTEGEGDEAAVLAGLTVVDLNGAGTTRDGVLGWAEFLERGAAVSEQDVLAVADAVAPDDLSEIIFTSGTTGRSKGVLLPHGPGLDLYATYARTWGLREGDRYLVSLPFFHTGGNKAGMMVSLQHGLTVVPSAVFDVEATLRLVETERVSVMNAPPTVYQSLMDSPRRADFDLSSLRLAATGAAVVPPALVERARVDLPFERLITAYGMTECFGTATLCRPGDADEVITLSNGRAVPGGEVRVVGPDGAVLPAGEQGEVLIRGPHVSPGYWEDPEATAEAVDRNGWLHSGDVGRLDEAGNLSITDRLKDIFIVGGFNVAPAEVEHLLARHPEVAEVAVVGVPDARLGEVARAFVVSRQVGGLTAEALVAWARERIANHKVPRVVEFVEHLPRNATGKVLRRELRGAVAAR